MFSTHSQWVLIQVRRLSFNHLNGHYTQGPNVHLRSVSLPGHHLRGHPVRCSYHGAAFTLLWCDLGAEAKIRCPKRQEMIKHMLQWHRLIHFKHQFGGNAVQDLLNLTEPSIPSNTLSLLMSLWITWFACRKSNACKHCGYADICWMKYWNMSFS